MPKEIFRSQFEKNQDPNEVLVRQPELSVHWGPTTGPDVQIGITLDADAARDAYYGLFAARGIEHTETLDAIVDALTEPESGALGWYTHLDRYDANRLIKTLRTARDKAFGRDE